VSEKRVSKSGCEHLYVLVWVVVRTLLIEALFVFICRRAPDPPTSIKSKAYCRKGVVGVKGLFLN